MAIGELVLAVCFASAITSAYGASAEWDPAIVLATTPDGSVYITVSPPLPPANTYELCMAVGMKCCGNVTQIQSDTSTLRFKVSDLPANRNYTITITAFEYDSAGRSSFIDRVFRRQPFYVPPSATSSVPTTTRSSSNDTLAQAPGDGTPDDVVLTTLVAVLALATIAASIVFACILLRKGYWRKLRYLLGRRPRDILQLYIMEDTKHVDFVQAHGRFLEKTEDVRIKDCAKTVRSEKDPEAALLNAMLISHYILVYVSSDLMNHFQQALKEEKRDGERRQDPQRNQENTFTQLCLKAILSLSKEDAADQRKRRLGSLGFVFVLSGCRHTDGEHKRFLEEHTRFPCVKLLKPSSGQYGVDLRPPRALFSKLYGWSGNDGCRNCIQYSKHWRNIAEAKQLLECAARLKGNTSVWDEDLNDRVNDHQRGEGIHDDDSEQDTNSVEDEQAMDAAEHETGHADSSMTPGITVNVNGELVTTTTTSPVHSGGAPSFVHVVNINVGETRLNQDTPSRGRPTSDQHMPISDHEFNASPVTFTRDQMQSVSYTKPSHGTPGSQDSGYASSVSGSQERSSVSGPHSTQNYYQNVRKIQNTQSLQLCGEQSAQPFYHPRNQQNQGPYRMQAENPNRLASHYPQGVYTQNPDGRQIQSPNGSQLYSQQAQIPHVRGNQNLNRMENYDTNRSLGCDSADCIQGHNSSMQPYHSPNDQILNAGSLHAYSPPSQAIHHHPGHNYTHHNSHMQTYHPDPRFSAPTIPQQSYPQNDFAAATWTAPPEMYPQVCPSTSEYHLNSQKLPCEGSEMQAEETVLIDPCSFQFCPQDSINSEMGSIGTVQETLRLLNERSKKERTDC